MPQVFVFHLALAQINQEPLCPMHVPGILALLVVLWLSYPNEPDESNMV